MKSLKFTVETHFFHAALDYPDDIIRIITPRGDEGWLFISAMCRA